MLPRKSHQIFEYWNNASVNNPWLSEKKITGKIRKYFELENIIYQNFETQPVQDLEGNPEI